MTRYPNVSFTNTRGSGLSGASAVLHSGSSVQSILDGAGSPVKSSDRNLPMSETAVIMARL